MKRPSNVIPGVGLTKSLCDQCSAPLIISWPGLDRVGEFCSHKCAKANFEEAEAKRLNRLKFRPKVKR